MIGRSMATILTLAALAAPAALAQNFGALAAAAETGDLTFEQAKVMLPQLTDVTFREADASGDGVIGPDEVPTLEALYRSLYMKN